MSEDCHIKILGTTDFIHKPELISKINQIFYDSGWDDSNSFFTKLLCDEYQRSPHFTVLFYKNNEAVGVRTLNIIGKNKIILENGCIVNASDVDYANFLKLVIYELVYGEFPIKGLMNALHTNLEDYYLLAYVEQNNFNSKARSTVCEIDDIGYVFNYLTKKGGYEETSFPGLKIDWSYYKQAFVVRVHKGEIIRRTLAKYVPDDCKYMVQSRVNSPKNRTPDASATESSIETPSNPRSNKRKKNDKK